MKKILLIIGFIFGFSQAHAIGMAGCGLGNVVMGDDGAQIFASTTNGTFSNQLFGITSGILNCETTDSLSAVSNTKIYMQANSTRVADDIARGSGSAVVALSKILGCNDAFEVQKVLKDNYKTIFPSSETSSDISSDAIIKTIKNDSRTSSSCSVV